VYSILVDKIADVLYFLIIASKLVRFQFRKLCSCASSYAVNGLHLAPSSTHINDKISWDDTTPFLRHRRQKTGCCLQVFSTKFGSQIWSSWCGNGYCGWLHLGLDVLKLFPQMNNTTANSSNWKEMNGSSLTIRIPPTPVIIILTNVSWTWTCLDIKKRRSSRYHHTFPFLGSYHLFAHSHKYSCQIGETMERRHDSWLESPQVSYPDRKEREREMNKIRSSLESESFGRATRIPTWWTNSHLSKKERESCPVFFFEEHFRKLLQTIQKPTTFTR